MPNIYQTHFTGKLQLVTDLFVQHNSEVAN